MEHALLDPIARRVAWLGYGRLPITGFLAHYWQDGFLVAATRLPSWYLPLRLRLKTVACLCLTAGAFAETW